MFFKKPIQRVLNQRLPSFERPKCVQCHQSVDEPKQFHIEQQGAPGVMKVHCLAQCPHCGTKHKVERMIGVGRPIRALEQSIHLYGEDDAALVRSLLPKYQANQGKLAEIHAKPVLD